MVPERQGRFVQTDLKAGITWRTRHRGPTTSQNGMGSAIAKLSFITAWPAVFFLSFIVAVAISGILLHIYLLHVMKTNELHFWQRLF